jgi:hypothetical protein
MTINSVKFLTNGCGDKDCTGQTDCVNAISICLPSGEEVVRVVSLESLSMLNILLNELATKLAK